MKEKPDKRGNEEIEKKVYRRGGGEAKDGGKREGGVTGKRDKRRKREKMEREVMEERKEASPDDLHPLSLHPSVSRSVLSLGPPGNQPTI